MLTQEREGREATRTRITEPAKTLASALAQREGSERWEPLRNLLLAAKAAAAAADAASRG